MRQFQSEVFFTNKRQRKNANKLNIVWIMFNSSECNKQVVHTSLDEALTLLLTSVPKPSKVIVIVRKF